jgi:hypothetical protein
MDNDLDILCRSLIEMDAAGYGNYIPACCGPILSRYKHRTEYEAITSSKVWDDKLREFTNKYVPIPKHLR